MSDYETVKFNSLISYLKREMPDYASDLNILQNLYTAKSGGYEVLQDELTKIKGGL